MLSGIGRANKPVNFSFDLHYADYRKMVYYIGWKYKNLNNMIFHCAAFQYPSYRPTLILALIFIIKERKKCV